MEWWILPAVVFFGAFGGFVNAILSGGERHTVHLPLVRGHAVELGLWGPVIIGVAAALLAWATALSDASIPALIGGSLLAGVAGSNYFTSKLRVQNYRSATEQAVEAADAAAEAAETMAQRVLLVDRGDETTEETN